MLDPRATPVNVSPLHQLERRSTSPQRLVRRGKIILAAATGATNTKITQDLHVDSDRHLFLYDLCLPETSLDWLSCPHT